MYIPEAQGIGQEAGTEQASVANAHIEALANTHLEQCRYQHVVFMIDIGKCRLVYTYTDMTYSAVSVHTVQ